MVVHTERRASLIDGTIENQEFADMPTPATLVPIFREVEELVATLDGLEPVVTRVLVGYREETHE